MAAGPKVEAIPTTELLDDFYECLHRAYRALREAFAKRGMTQDDVAAKLDIDKALVSKRLRGLENMTLKTLSAMASALSCRLLVIFQPFEDIPGHNYYFQSAGSVEIVNAAPTAAKRIAASNRLAAFRPQAA